MHMSRDVVKPQGAVWGLRTPSKGIRSRPQQPGPVRQRCRPAEDAARRPAASEAGRARAPQLVAAELMDRELTRPAGAMALGAHITEMARCGTRYSQFLL